MSEALKSSQPYPAYPATYSVQQSIKTDWMLSASGRLGVWPTVTWPLVYATGGVALTNPHISTAFNDNDPSSGIGRINYNKIKTGFIVGGGLEFPLTKYLTLNGEYLFVNFGSISASGTIYNSANAQGGLPPGFYVSPFSTSAHLTANIFKFGLNYKFS